ncbi:MAG: hypothetical protein HXX13_00375 [Bacteroidetes bacterium]|nr:hypothetical protein [Bacteroidota bacterium]
MKKFLCLFLVILLFLQSGGLLIFFRVEIAIQQHRMKEVLEKDCSGLEHISLSVNEFNLSRTSNNEILLDSKRFDIKSWHISGNRVNIEVLHDSTEESLNLAVNHALDPGFLANRGFIGKILSLLTLDYMFPFSVSYAVIHSFGAKIDTFYISSFHFHFPEILTPPPRLFTL